MAKFFRDQGGQLHEFPDDATPDEMAKAVEAQGNLNTFSQRNPSPAPKTYPPINDVVRSIANGASFGFADEIAAGANTVLPITPEAKGSYSSNLKAERSKDAAFRKDYPGSAMSAELAGGLLTGVPGAAKVMTAKALAKVPAWLKAAGIGAAAGGAAGFGAGEGGLGPRLESAAIPAALGAVGGFAVPYIIAGGKKILMPLVNRYRNAGLLSDQKILEALERAGLTPAAAAKQLEDLGPAATLADIGGKPVARLARGTAGASSKAEELAAKTYEGRQAGQGERVAGEAARTISSNQDFYGTVDELTAARKAAAAPLYEKAYQAGDMFSDQLSTLAKRPSMRQALGRAYRIAAEEGRDPAELGLMLNKDGEVDLGKVPTMQTWDYVKRGLDDVIEQFRDKVTGKLRLDESGRAINATKTDLLGELDRLNPDYAAARASYAGPSQSLDALALGRGILGKDAEITAKRIAGLSDGDKAFFRAGVVRAMKDLVDGAPDGADAVKKLWGKPALREKLRAAFPDDASFAAFQKAMDRETIFYRTRANALQGSRTAPMTKDIEDLTQHPAVPLLGDIATGNTGGAISRSLGMARDYLSRPTGRVAEALGPKLFTMDPVANREMLLGLGRRPPPLATANARRAGVATGLSNLIGLELGQR